jgi:serine phosphatase RsbU (regulator of sigma subunit)
MQIRTLKDRLDETTRPLRLALHYAFYDWTREMPPFRRFITWAGILIQGYAVFALWTRSLAWPLMWPRGLPLYVCVALLYVLGAALMNGMLTSEFFRKTQLEADQIAAAQIQQTLQPQRLDELQGYELETFYKPFREVGGDYFDVIDLAGSRTLFVVADVSGKGMPAALLAANIQALVRIIANLEADPLAMARQINKHLCRYTPSDRFATAVFILLSRETGELTYVNAGHNAPILLGSEPAVEMEATGMPLGLFSEAVYEARTALLSPAGFLLVFTDGFTDSISAENPDDRLRDALADGSGTTMLTLKSLVDPHFNEDDVTILLLKRDAGETCGGRLG